MEIVGILTKSANTASLLEITILMDLYAALLLAHLIADFPLQTSTIYALKVKSWKGVVIHVTVHVAVTLLLVDPLQSALPLVAILAVAHFVTDQLKVHWPVEHQWPGFLLDQVAHILVLIFLGFIGQGVVSSVLPMALVWPLLVYTGFLALLIFFWTLATDLYKLHHMQHPLIEWAHHNLLILSSYGGVFLFAALWHYLYRHTVRLFANPSA